MNEKHIIHEIKSYENSSRIVNIFMILNHSNN